MTKKQFLRADDDVWTSIFLGSNCSPGKQDHETQLVTVIIFQLSECRK